MEYMKQPSVNLPVERDVDVVVAGGGISGMFAAIAAGRMGARTVLVERLDRLGGNLGPGFLLGGSACAETGAFLRTELPSVPRELFARMEPLKSGVLVHDYAETSHLVSYLAQVMAEEAGVETVFSAYASDPIMEGDRVAGLCVDGKSGRVAFKARVVIDATGDANLARRAGAPIIQAVAKDFVTFQRLGEPPVPECDVHNESALFCLIGDVDIDVYRRFIESNDEVSEENLRWAGQHFRGPKVHPLPRALYPAMREAWEKNEFRLVRNMDDPKVCVSTSGNQLQPYGKTLFGGRCVNAYGPFDAGNMWHIARLEAFMRKQTVESVLFLKKYAPGFENARLLCMSSFVGGRSAPFIEGRHTLTIDDTAGGRRFDDVIFQDFFKPRKPTLLRPDSVDTGYDIPYRIMLPLKIENMLVIGRGAAYMRRGHDGAGQMRGRPVQMTLGQAAGMAAALSARQAVPPGDIDVKVLQRQLLQAGFNLGDDARLRELGLI